MDNIHPINCCGWIAAVLTVGIIPVAVIDLIAASIAGTGEGIIGFRSFVI